MAQDQKRNTTTAPIQSAMQRRLAEMHDHSADADAPAIAASPIASVNSGNTGLRLAPKTK